MGSGAVSDDLNSFSDITLPWVAHKLAQCGVLFDSCTMARMKMIKIPLDSLLTNNPQHPPSHQLALGGVDAALPVHNMMCHRPPRRRPHRRRRPSPPGAAYPFVVRASALRGLEVAESDGSDLLAEMLPPTSTSWSNLKDSGEGSRQKALLREPVAPSPSIPRVHSITRRRPCRRAWCPRRPPASLTIGDNVARGIEWCDTSDGRDTVDTAESDGMSGLRSVWESE